MKNIDYVMDEKNRSHAENEALKKDFSHAKILNNFCAWSDLLGFGSMVSKNDWSPTIEDWEKVYNRLSTVQNIYLHNFDLVEKCLISNDALIRTYDVDYTLKINKEELEKKVECPITSIVYLVSLWIWKLVDFFNTVNAIDKGENNYPGMRLVLAAGTRFEYGLKSVSWLDMLPDEVLKGKANNSNYNLPDNFIGSPSYYMRKNKIIYYIHDFLQMNTAFSKSYLIDSLGTKGGVPGPNFYIDKSAIQLLIYLAKELKYDYESYDDGDYTYFYIKTSNNRNLYGFKMSQIIHVKGDKEKIVSDVYKLISYELYDDGEIWIDIKS